jgi:hypothetical protein
MKKLWMLGLVLIFAFGITFISGASDQNKVEKLMSTIKSGEVNLWNDVGDKVVYIYENTGQHNHFETKYKKHYAIINKSPSGNECLTLIVRDYQNYYQSHDSRGFILIALVDYNKDGEVDDWRKDYVILLDEATILIPNYPPGYLNQEWFKLTQEEAQKIFDEELNYILENIDKAKKG